MLATTVAVAMIVVMIIAVMLIVVLIVDDHVFAEASRKSGLEIENAVESTPPRSSTSASATLPRSVRCGFSSD